MSASFTKLFIAPIIILFIISFFILTSSSYAHERSPDDVGNCTTNHSLNAAGDLCIPDVVTDGDSATSSISGGGGPDIGIIGITIPFKDLGGIVNSLLTLAFVAAGIFFLIQVVIGGIGWINAGGDPKAMESARGRITNAVIGLVIVVAAFAITLIVTTLLGVNIFSGTIDIVP